MKVENKRIEEILYNIPVRKIEVNNLRLELENSKKKYDIYREVQKENREEYQEQIVNKITFKENEIKKVENSLDILDEREKIIVDMKYFKKYSNTKIAYELHVATAYVTELKNKIIKKLIPLLLV